MPHAAYLIPLDCSAAGVAQPTGPLVDTEEYTRVGTVVRWGGQTLLGSRLGWVGDGDDAWHSRSEERVNGLRNSTTVCVAEGGMDRPYLALSDAEYVMEMTRCTAGQTNEFLASVTAILSA